MINMKRRKSTLNKISLAFLASLLFFNCLAQVASAQASIYHTILAPFYDPNTTSIDTCSATDTSSPSTSTGSVYMIGDSIGNRSSSTLSADFQKAGWKLSINAEDGRNLPQGISEIGGVSDQTQIKNSNAVVIELGTNSAGSTPTNISAMITKVKSLNPSARIYWVDTAVIDSQRISKGYTSLASTLSNVNENIYNSPASKISWNKAVLGNNADPKNIDPAAKDTNGYIDASDGLGVHPTNDKGVPALSALIVSAVTGSSTSSGGASCCTSDSSLNGTNGVAVISFFVGKGLSPTQAAGIVGNMTHESSLQPQRLQGTSPGVKTPAESLSASQLADTSLGWGIVQWTPPGKMINTFNPTSKANDLETQLEFVWTQLTGTGALAEDPSILPDIKSVADNDILNAVLAFQGNENGTAGKYAGDYRGFERPADEGGSVVDRVTFATRAFNAYNAGGSAAPIGGGVDCGGETSTTAGAQIVGDIGLNSDKVDCAPGTKDLGIVRTRYTGEFKKEQGPLIIRLCQVPDVPGEGNNTSGVDIGGGVVVNSRVSGAWRALGVAAKKDGIDLFGTSSFRLADSCNGTGNGGACATPGGSPHQMGVAIDFYNQMYNVNENAQSCSVRVTKTDSPQWRWMYKNAEKFGFKQYSAEAWHWDPIPTSNRCSSSEPAGLVP